jgi:hypothetical protein
MIPLIILIIILVFIFYLLFSAKPHQFPNVNPETQKEYKSVSVIYIPGPKNYSENIVGEAKYQNNLDYICGGKSYNGHEKYITAYLIQEDDNPYDDQAIRIEINGRIVGYLSRKEAGMYRNHLNKMGYSDSIIACDSVIVGGWKRNQKDEGHFGVKLDLPLSSIKPREM